MEKLGTLLDGKGYPSAFDGPSNYLGNREGFDWLLLLSKTRDADILTESNWDNALELLGGEDEENGVKIIRHGHWAVGWIEYLLINPDNKEKVNIANDIEKQLESYPVLNEEDFSNREYEYAQESWEKYTTISERVELCQKAGVSVFAARHDYMPQDDNGYIYESLI